MSNTRINPYEAYPETIIDADAIAGYAYKHLNQYFKTKVSGEDFLPVLFSVLQHESAGFNKYVKAAGNETSYGLFQINWHAHHKDIHANFSQFQDAGVRAVDVIDMTDEEYKKFVDIIADLDFQFSYAKVLMDRKSAKGRNIFEDWSAYTNGSYNQYMDLHIPPSNIYLNKSENELFGLAQQTDTGGGGTGGQIGNPNDLSQYDPANSNMFTGEPTSPEEQWKQIKQFYGKDFYDYETDKWLPGAEDTEGFKQWSITFDNGLEGDNDLSYSEYLDNFGSVGAASELVDETFGKVTAQTGFYNPFRISALGGSPTVADTVKIAVYDKYLNSAINQGFSRTVAESLALGHLANPFVIDIMNRAVTRGLESGLALPEMVDQVSQAAASYTSNNETKSWTYRLPVFKDARIPEQNAIAQRINDKVSSVLLINDPGLTDQIKRSYTDYKIMNPNTQVSIEDFAMPFIKDTRRYNRIYQQKPPQFSEEQYIGQYSSAVGGVMGLGDPNYNNAVTSSASVGATNQETQTAATFGSPGVGLGDTFRDKVSALGERIGGMFNK